MKTVFRICARVIGLVLATATASLGSAYDPAATIGGTASERATGAAPASPMACCKICTKGKACGNSCIHQSYTCHKGRGCACNASEVCE